MLIAGQTVEFIISNSTGTPITPSAPPATGQSSLPARENRALDCGGGNRTAKRAKTRTK